MKKKPRLIPSISSHHEARLLKQTRRFWHTLPEEMRAALVPVLAGATPIEQASMPLQDECYGTVPHSLGFAWFWLTVGSWRPHAARRESMQYLRALESLNP